MAKTLTVYLAADLKKFNSGMDQAGRKADGFSTSLRDKMGPALLAAGAAAGAFAAKLAVDGVRAAIEDEKAVAQLANTLGNLNLAHDTSAVEGYIYELERAYGVADTDLRPAYERLVRSTKDTEEANRALKTAMDISAATGKSLTTVTDTLGRAYDGSTTSLSRLGVGLDQTQLAAMSLDEIMGTLSRNFAGSADAAANTFEGRLTRLKTATDNLAEAFGAGLLDSLNDATNGTQDAVDAMEDLEPLLKGIGKAAGDNITAVAGIAGAIGMLAQNAGAATENMGPLGKAIDIAIGGITASPLVTLNNALQDLLGNTGQLTGSGSSAGQYNSLPDLSKETEETTEAWMDNRYAVQGAQAALARMYAPLSTVVEETADLGRTTGSATAKVEQLTKKQKELLKTSEEMGLALQGTIGDIQDQAQAFIDAQRAVDDYSNQIRNDLLAGFDLMDLYNEAKEGGGDIGQGLNEGVDAALAHVEWGGNVLNALQAAKVDQSLIEYLSSVGPEGGWELGQAMLDDRGLMGSLNEKWTDVRALTQQLADELVPDAMQNGRDQAEAKLDGMIEQFQKDQKKFKKLGKQIGRQIGASFKEQIAKDVAEAVRQVEAAATAARAEAVAAAERREALKTEQAVATALSNLISNADKRSGRDVSPTLA